MLRAREADFQVGGRIMRTRQRELTRGVRGNLKLKSVEMDLKLSKVKLIFNSYKTTSNKLK